MPRRLRCLCLPFLALVVLNEAKPGYLEDVLGRLLNAVGPKLIAFAVIAIIVGYAIKKVRGH